MNSDDKTVQGNIEWPPSPSLPPPSLPEPQPLIIRISVWMVALIDAGIIIFSSGLAYLRLHKSHHITPWFDIVMEGLAPGSLIFGVHLWLRYRWRKRHTDDAA
jgi:hypothetical protein